MFSPLKLWQDGNGIFSFKDHYQESVRSKLIFYNSFQTQKFIIEITSNTIFILISTSRPIYALNHKSSVFYRINDFTISSLKMLSIYMARYIL